MWLLYQSPKDFIKELDDQVKIFQQIVASGEINEAKAAGEEIKKLDMLIDLLKMSAEDLQLISEAINYHTAIQNAQKELDYLKGDSDAKEKDVSRLWPFETG